MTATAEADLVGDLFGRQLRRSALSPLLQQALALLPEPDQLDAARIAVLSELGFKDMEIAKQLGITWRKLEDHREALRAGIVDAMRGDGYTNDEVRRTLRIPSSQVASLRLRHRPSCMVAISGDGLAHCNCHETHGWGP